jgi:hypothetical protein
MITGKLNLLNLTVARQMVKGKLGEIDCLVIPIEKNRLFVGEKGNYLDLIAFEIKDPKPDRKDTHLIKQSFSKEVREAMTDEQLKAIPILGSLTVGSSGVEKDPVSDPKTLSADDDLPF